MTKILDVIIQVQYLYNIHRSREVEKSQCPKSSKAKVRAKEKKVHSMSMLSGTNETWKRTRESGLFFFFFFVSGEREKGSSIVRIIFFSTSHCSFVKLLLVKVFAIMFQPLCLLSVT